MILALDLMNSANSKNVLKKKTFFQFIKILKTFSFLK